MGTTEEELKNLNQRTFDAEAKPEEPIDGKGWKEFLQDTLAVNFSIRRVNGAVQNKLEMIEFVEDSKRTQRTIIEDTIKVFCGFEDKDPSEQSFGVVTSVVTFKGSDKKYHNIKTFARRFPGHWRCIYWQVFEVQ